MPPYRRERANGRSTILADLGLTGESFAVATVHRAENTDNGTSRCHR